MAPRIQLTERDRRALQLTERDRRVLELLSEHRFLLTGQVRAFLGAGRFDARLRALADAGYIRRTPFLHREQWCIQITGAGLRAIDSKLPVPKLKLEHYRHDVGVGWLWLAVRGGAFGEMREVIGERRMRSRDGAALDREPLGIRLGGLGAHGLERLHYPDLLMVTGDGRRIALELELSWKGPRRTEGILAGYAADSRVGGILYLVESRTVGRSVERCADRLGMRGLVGVQMVRFPRRGAERARVVERAEPQRAGLPARGMGR